MANEFKHKSVGSELSQTEYESTTGHNFGSNQAIGDLLYASSTTALLRLGIGATGAVLTVTGGIPTWDATWTPTGHLIPATDDSYDLGSASAAWQDLFLEGDITLTDAGTLATSAGALTVTSAAAATWSTSAGALTLNGTGGVVLQEGGAAIISISDARAVTTANTASIALDATGVIELNSSGGALSIGNDNVDQTVNIATAGTRTLNIGIGDGTDVTTTLVKGTLSVGVDDAGYDVIFYGDAASANMTWDTSEDDLILNGAARIVIPDGQLVLASTAVSSTAAELNVLDGLARGSVIYGNASAATTALAAGSANTVLKSDGTDIAWGSITVLGTIATGVWEGTDVGVEHGGTGVSTLLTNAVLTGNGTGNIQAESTLLFSSNKLIPTATAHDAAGTALTMSAGATTAGTTNNIAGGALTFQGGQGKGSGAGGDIVFQTANAAGSGSSLNALATALTLSDDLSAAFAGAVTVAGNLTVSGTTTTVNTVTMNAANAIVFEGATANTEETTLTIVDPDADRTIYLPNQSGYIPVFAAETSSAQISTTVAELNLIDGGTARGTDAVGDGDGVLINDGGTMRMTTVQTLATYLAGVNAGTVTATGISDSSGVLTLDIQNMTASTGIADADLVVIDDGAGGTLRKMTRANFIESAALDAINIDGGAIDGTAIGANSAAAGTFAAIAGTTGTFSGVLDVTDTTDASDASGDTGALRTEGGASVAKKLYVGTDLDVDGTAELDNITIAGAQGSDGQVLTSTGSGVGWEDGGGGGITHAQQWRVDQSTTGETDITPIENWEVADNATQGPAALGTAMTYSSGEFTFPVEGTWLIEFGVEVTQTGSDDVSFTAEIQTCVDGSSYGTASRASGQLDNGNVSDCLYMSFVFDVDSTLANHKVRFRLYNFGSQCTMEGSSSENQTYATFIRLGDAP